MTTLFRVKICGITRALDAMAVGEAGGDAIGLNFYAPSPRFIRDDQARTIVHACPASVQKVGVFVNEPIDDILRRVDMLGLDWVQLHGDEPPTSIAALSGVKVIRAFRCRDHQLRPVQNYLQRCRAVGRIPDAVLLDAWHQDQFGGTGKTLNWDSLSQEIGHLVGLPWILAGGLHARNVSAAIRQLKPDAVDTASGVESAPGVKDAREIAEFVRAAHAADVWPDP